MAFITYSDVISWFWRWNLRLLQSDASNPVKIFKVAASDSLPRTAQQNATTLAAIFPGAATNIPQPLTSALSSFTPAQVYLFGGSAGSRLVGKYNFNSAAKTFTFVSKTNVLSSQYNADITAATMYYNTGNGTSSYFIFSQSQTAQVNTALTVSIAIWSSYCQRLRKRPLQQASFLVSVKILQ